MSRDISKLSAFMQSKWYEFKKQCEAEKLGVIIVCTDRGEEEQNACLASGASRAAYGYSAHNAVLGNGKAASEAWDIGVIVNGKYVGDSSHPSYQRAGAIGEALGLKWYGNPKATFKEAAHFQNPAWVKPKA